MSMANSSNIGNAIRDDGKPRLNRNQRRMNDYNNRRAGRDWNDMMSVEEKEHEALKKNESKQNNAKFYTQRKERKKQQKSGKPDKPRQMAPEDMLGETVTPTVDEQLWDEGGYCGTHPVQNVYAQNVDFSTFPAILEVSYAQMEVVNPRLRREMPFCLYQHAMTEALHIYLIKQAKGENMDLEFMNDGPPVNILPDDFVMPLMVSEYIRTVATRVNATGDEIRVNYPVAGRPQVRDGDVHSGFFGVCDQDSHNAYECYPSPAVSMELINRTAEANRHPNREGAFGAWHPLPATHRPNAAQCTPNLLGYRIPERLTPEGLTKCENLVFANGNTLAARVCDCPQVTMLVSNTLRKLEKDIKMTNEFLTPKASLALTGYVYVSDQSSSTEPLARSPCSVRSPAALGSGASNKCGLFGLRRKRSEAAPGYCFVTAQGAGIINWNNTINSNFTMEGRFSPLVGIDRPSFREFNHEDVGPAGNRIIQIQNLANRGFLIAKSSR